MTDQSYGEALMTVLEMMRQCAEAARGYRAHLEGMGFSPTFAEQASLHFLLSLQQQAFEGGPQ